MMPQQMAGLQGMQRPQGVAALPSGMNEQSMAGGGIVAFDDGGYVNEEMQYAGGGIVAFAKGDEVEDPFANLSFEDKLRLAQAQSESGDGIATKRGLFKPLSPLDAIQNSAFNKNIMSRTTPTTSSQVKSMMPADEIKGNEQALFDAESLARKIAPKGETLPTVGERGRMAPTTKADLDSEGKTKENMYDKYEKMITEQAAQGKLDRQQDKYMRLLEAGLGIMGGTSQHALTNIGQGAMGAAKGYAQDKASYRKEDRDTIKELMGLGMKREEAERESQKLGMTEKLYGAHGRYYDAAAQAAGVRAAAAGTNAGTAANTRLTIAQQNLVHKYFQDLKKDMNNMGVSDDVLMQKAMGMAGVQGGPAAAPIAVGSWSPKGGLTLAGS
jgi:hypothetical protein